MRPSARFAFELLAKDKPASLTVAEIGVYKGQNAHDMLSSGAIKTLYLIDPYESARGYDDAQECNVQAPEVSRQEAMVLLAGFQEVVWMQTTSAEAVKNFPDGIFDYVYIDGDHRYEHVYEDAMLYWQKVREGGVLAGHDYHQTYQPELHAGVTRAVDDFAKHIGRTVSNEDVDWWVIK